MNSGMVRRTRATGGLAPADPAATRTLAATIGGVPEDLRSTATMLLQLSSETRILIHQTADLIAQVDVALLQSRQLRNKMAHKGAKCLW